ncbi:uncharacterized protein LOC110536013 isoform X2 [Oncorhynchus mykiss]|uniref:uncharacterized protein LOC110536013 isoform X2 n=1 Tax=Oncorhynchus mykiss TaxID=8022 RepID=UPI000B4FA6C7|nr:uncharacterized protein LOC110536013 isoform X2 [Oncorhynchus mykiss]
MVSIFAVHVVFLLIRCANFLSMHCNCSQAPNGTTTYHLSEPPPSMNCETEWAYPNGSTLTFKGETNANQVLGLTRQSITTTVCLGSLKYTVDCVKPQVVNKVECNCTMEPSSPSNPDHIKDVRPDERSHTLAWIPVGCFAVVIILLFAGESYRCVDRSRNRTQRTSVNVDNAEETKV